MTTIVWIKMKQINYFEILPTVKKLFFPLAIMVFFVLLLKYLHINVIVNILIAMSVYFSALFFFKEPLLKEMRQLINI